MDGELRYCVDVADSSQHEAESHDERTENDAIERRRVESQLAGENRLLQMVASGCELSSVLASLCRFVEEAAPECICGTYLIDWSLSAFKKGAAPSLPASFLEAVEGLPVRTELCPCGVAALEKRQVIADDLESDPAWRDTPYRGLLLSHGILQYEDFLSGANQLQALPDFELLLGFIFLQALYTLAPELNLALQIGILLFQRANLILPLN